MRSRSGEHGRSSASSLFVVEMVQTGSGGSGTACSGGGGGGEEDPGSDVRALKGENDLAPITKDDDDLASVLDEDEDADDASAAALS